MAHRNRAWRRKQRRRLIQSRQDRIRNMDVSRTFARYQLHTEYGEPLPIFHRVELKEGERPSTLVPVRMEKFFTIEVRRPTWPGGQVGMVWKYLKTYTHEDKFKFGTLDKMRVPKRRWNGTWTAVESKPVKNWKLMYSRSSKVKRGSQLGFLYPVEKFRSHAHFLSSSETEEVACEGKF